MWVKKVIYLFYFDIPSFVRINFHTWSTRNWSPDFVPAIFSMSLKFFWHIKMSSQDFVNDKKYIGVHHEY